MVHTYIYLEPALYDRFSCEMCGTCCRNEWLVTLNEDSYYRNKQLFTVSGRSQEFEQAFIRLSNGCRDEYAFIAKQQGEGGCWFLDSTNYCRLHREAGHEHLDSVCQIYPRYPIHTSRGMELTLSYSCPAVLKLVVQNNAPLTITRSEQPPKNMGFDTYAAQVFPRQQPKRSPLRYYFELEQHVIDILQSRCLTIQERLLFLQTVVGEILEAAKSDELDRLLQQIFFRNYQFLDEKAALQQAGQSGKPEETPADILLEHFLVNLVFKKVGFLYGLKSMVRLLQLACQYTAAAQQEVSGTSAKLARTEAAIVHLEIQYSHNRKALFNMVNKQEEKL